MSSRTSLEAIYANCDEVGECLEWRGPFGCGRNKGTPIVKVAANGKRTNAPVVRLVWEQTRGPIPDGKIVYRHCCNYKCVACLKLGVRGDVHRLRKKLGKAAHSPTTIVAITNGSRARHNVKNSIEKARECRALSAQGLSDPKVSELTGVHPEMVANIRRGEAWKEHAAPASVFSWRP